MIRTGELIGRESGGALNLEYLTSRCPDTTTSPTSERAGSTGGSMIYDPAQWQNNWTRGGVCGMCHNTAEPYWREAKDILNCVNCHTSGTHVAHLEASYGPLIASCDACHDMNNFPLFSDGQNLANTTVCDPCHSPGGAYDGVNDPNIGAKGNWVSGVYNGSAFQAGKEKWCVGCHDDDPSVLNGVSAPNIAGDDTSFGYYKTGHGKHGNEQAVTCLACHDPALMHVDGEARTYAAAADNYQAGYRLKSVDGEAPMEVPRPSSSPTAPEQFRLCFSCHDSTPFMTMAGTTVTNFRSDVDDSCVPRDPSSNLINQHWYHLQSGGAYFRWDSDWDGTAYDSLLSCAACHNVHGPKLKDDPNYPNISHVPAMIRTGELIGRESALNLDQPRLSV